MTFQGDNVSILQFHVSFYIRRVLLALDTYTYMYDMFLSLLKCYFEIE